MAEFVDHHGPEVFVAGGGQGIGIVYASASVSFCICEYYDVFVRHCPQPVVQVFQMQGSQVAGRVESVETGVQGSIFPQPFRRDAYPALAGTESNGPEVEPVLETAERLGGQNRTHGPGGVGVELFFLGSGVAFSYDGHVYALLHGTADGNLPDLRSLGGRAYEYVRGVHSVSETAGCAAVGVVQLDAHRGRSFRHRKEKDIFEAAFRASGFFGVLPFLKQCAE